MTEGEAASTGKRILGESESKSGKLDSPSPLAQPPIQCPECAAHKVWKDGLRYIKHGDKQRWLCRTCGYRFSETQIKVNIGSQVLESSKSNNDLAHDVVTRLDSTFKESVDDCSLLRSKDVASHRRTVVGQRLNSFRDYNSTRRVCVSNHEMKNLVKVETRQKQAAGATSPDEADIRGKLVEFLWYMKKGGYSESTIETYSTILSRLFHSGLNLYDPETIKEYLAKQDCSQSYKNVIIGSYTLFLKTQRMKWDPPLCKPTRRLPFIPTERELDDLISASGKKTATFLQLLKETAMRVGEASKLRWVDVDLQRKTLILNNPEKSGKPRIFTLSNKLVTMLALLPKRTEYLFGTNSKKTRNGVYYAARKRIAHKLGNPRLHRIGFHTFRHWKATMLYHETRDPLLVKEFLGHRSLDTTLLYIQLEKALFDSTSDEFTVKATSDPEEIQALLEVGFEYVCDKDGLMFFKKRK